MNNYLKITLIACLLIAIAGWLIQKNYKSLVASEASLAAITRQRVALDARVGIARAKLMSVEEEQAVLQATVTKVRAETPESSIAPTDSSKPPDAATLLVNNPDLFALYAKAFRADLGNRYGFIFHAVGLTPDQIETISDLMTEEAKEKEKLLATAAAQGLDQSDPDVKAMLRDLAMKYNQSQAALIGQETSDKLAQLNRALPLVSTVNVVASSVALSPDSLTSQQGVQLLQILRNANDRSGLNWPDVLQQAQSILSPPQLAVLKVQYQFSELGKATRQFYQQQSATK